MSSLWRKRPARHDGLAPLCEAAASGHVPSALELLKIFLRDPDPELARALAHQTHPEVREAIAVRWMRGREPELQALVEGWGWLPAGPPKLRFELAVLLNRPLPEPVYLPMILAEPRAWSWLSADQLFELELQARLPEGLRQRLSGLPEEPATRAAYLLLSDRLEELDAFDEDGAWLSQAYERFGAGLRTRILAALRRIGRSELAVRVAARRELAPDEWEAQFELLKARPDELWRLVPGLPAAWAARALDFLRSTGYGGDEAYRELLQALPPELSLAPERILTSSGVPLAWIAPRSLLLSGPQLCQVDLQAVHHVSLPLGAQPRTWRLSPEATRLAVNESFNGGAQYATRLRTAEIPGRLLLSRPPLPEASPLAFSPDGRWLAVLELGTLRLFPTEPPCAPRWELSLPHPGRLLFLSDEELLLASDSQLARVDVADGRLRWLVSSDVPEPRLRARDDRLLCFAGRQLRVYCRLTGRRLAVLEAPERSQDALLGPGETVLTAGATRLERRDALSGELLAGYDGAHSHPCRFAPDAFRLARARGHQLELVDTFEGRASARVALPGPVTELVFSPDGLLLAVGVAGRQTHVFAVPPSTSTRHLTPDAMSELRRLGELSPAWRFLDALARHRMRHAVTVEEWAPEDAYMIEIAE